MAEAETQSHRPVEVRCDTCGWIAPAEAGYRSRRRGWRLRRVSECPRCRTGRRQRNERLAAGLFVALVLVILVGSALFLVHLVGWRQAAPLLWIVTGMLLFVLFLYPLVLVHEMGHALAARLVGLHVFRITFAAGPVIWRSRFAGIPVEIGRLWYYWPSGCARFAHPGTRLLRCKHFLTVAAGPAANALVLLLAVAVLVGYSADMIRFFAWVTIAANSFLLLSALIPHRITIDGVTLPSDGMQILSTPFLSRQAIASFHAQFFAQHGDECLRAGRHEDALAWYHLGLTTYPNDALCTLGIALALFRLGRLEETVAHCRESMERDFLPPIIRAHLADTAATAVLHQVMALRLRGSADTFLEQGLRVARACCRDALAQEKVLDARTHASFLATLGCLLVEDGEPSEGKRHLRCALARLDEPTARAYCFAYLAVASRHAPEEACAFLDSAVQLAPEHPAVLRALVAVQAPPGGILMPPAASAPDRG